MQVQLSKVVVEMRDELGWYDQEQVKAQMVTGSKMDTQTQEIGINGKGMFEAKLKLLELSIISIKEGEKVIPFSLDWIKSLSAADGNMLDEALEKLDAKKG